MKAFVLFAILMPSFVFAETPATPRLFFSYSYLYDQNCPAAPEKSTWAQEASAREGDFAKIWEKAEPILFGKVYELFGKGFSRKELTATLTVCKGPSFSNPLVLNVRPYLKSFMGSNPVFSDEAFADLVFHELLHTWVGENLPMPSPIRQKYINEDPSVRSHLHLMAMQMYIYTQLNRPDLIEMIGKQYTAMSSPQYKRAWEIVSQIEGYQPFIDELKPKN